MTLPIVALCVIAPLVVFGLAEGVILVALIGCELAGAACGGRFLSINRLPGGKGGLRLATMGFILGQMFVGVATPYLVLMLLAPRGDWLVKLATGMATASGGIGGSALLVMFLAGLLAPTTGPVSTEKPTESRTWSVLLANDEEQRRRGGPCARRTGTLIAGPNAVTASVRSAFSHTRIECERGCGQESEEGRLGWRRAHLRATRSRPT